MAVLDLIQGLVVGLLEDLDVFPGLDEVVLQGLVELLLFQSQLVSLEEGLLAFFFLLG